MKKIYYNKLIRDEIPSKIKENKGEYEVRSLSLDEFEQELLKKVMEEASGLLKTTTREELLDELVDITIVLEEIKKTKKIEEGEFQEARRRNMVRKGGFFKKLFLVWSSDTSYKTNEISYPKKVSC
ncbi:nucleoside triphosphate pyrophosphohydrolase [Candidatus Woesearchaeota archaeon]|nr:nucleoside triphosphate pyrophosphohydrolase [Candidatus Woesearchaeota archaeon]